MKNIMDKFTEKTRRLFQLGDINQLNGTKIYDEINFSRADIPELIRLATNKSLLEGDLDDVKNWAPIHAWQILAKMQATEAIDKFIALFDELEDSFLVDEEMPEIFAQFGAAALPALEKYIKNQRHGIGARITAGACVKEIGRWHEDAREECVHLLTSQLEKFEENEAEFNGFLVWYLMDLQAAESIAAIKEAFQRDCVDESIVGDISNVEYQLKLTDKKPQVHIFAEESFREDENDKEKI